MTHDAYRGLPDGTFHIQAQEQVVFGQPADSAVVALAQQLGAYYAFL